MSYLKYIKTAGISLACLSSFILGTVINAKFDLDVKIKREGRISIGNLIGINSRSEQEIDLSANSHTVGRSPEPGYGTVNDVNSNGYINISNETKTDENNTKNLLDDPDNWSIRLFDGTIADFDIQPNGDHTVYVSQVSDKTYGAKVIYRNLHLSHDQTYTLEFDAYCMEGTGKIGAGIMEEETWASDAYSELEITTEKTHYTIHSDPVSDHNYPMRLFIDFGFVTGTYRIENISITLNR